MRFTTGQHIGRYVIESLLGEGGMGEVYRARDSRLERSVALKVLRNETESSSEEWDHAVLRMQREAQAVAALSHPGIVAIYDIGEHESIPFIAMELVGGQPLRDLIGKDPQRTTNLRILLDVARALGAAHDAGFVHRDIKPENILVRQDGMAKILDFGIARKASLNGDRAGQTLDVQGTTIDAALVGMTAEGAIVGTPAYMSPEQLRGEVVDARADQFAWGVVAYELLSGRHPFHAEKGAIGLLSAILSEDPAPLEGLPAGVTDVVLRALEKDPEKRWASMQEIAKNWESFITNGDSRKLPVVAPQDGVVSPSQTANSSTNVRRPQARWMIAPMITLAALTAVVAFAFRKPAEVSVAPVAASSAMAAPPKPMTVTDQPIPVSTSPVAIAEFRQGLQYIRDAQWTAAARAFAHARNADPGMAAAHMRYSFIHYSYDITIAREAYRKAVGLRSTLTERDQGFLHALEPVMLRTPGDFREAAKRFESLVDRYPQDAELTFWLARALYYSDPNPAASERVVELNSRCTELDPQYADCWQMKAQGLVRLGKAEDAGKALNQCVQISENAVDCLIDAISYESTLGRCDAVVEMAKRLKAKDPNALHVGFILPEALYYTGADEPVVRAAFEEAEKQSREAGRIFEAEKALFMMAVSYGEFTKALDIANKMKTLRAPTAEAELELWLERAALYLELDRPLDAAKLAEEFLIASALHPQERSMKYLDPSIVMHSLRLHAGRLTTSEFQRLRSEWLAKQSPKGIAEEVIVWMYAYAFPAITPELAKDAVENISPKIVALSPQKQPLPKIFDSHYGKVLAKVGQHAQAIPRIEEALRVCTTNDTTMWTTQQRALLGYAYEATGDKPKACAQYQRVEALWGKSKQSRTVKEVNKRVKKLGCESTAGQGTP